MLKQELPCDSEWGPAPVLKILRRSPPVFSLLCQSIGHVVGERADIHVEILCHFRKDDFQLLESVVASSCARRFNFL